MPSHRQGAIFSLFVPILLYTLSFLILTWPLVKYFSVGVVGLYGSDSPIYLWNAWLWQKKFLLGDWSFFTQEISFPHTQSLLMHTSTLFNSILIFIFDLFAGNLVLSYNLVYWLSAVLGAYFAFRFYLLITDNFPAALLAGHFFGFQHLWGVYSIFGTQNIITIWPIAAVLFFYEYFCQHGKKWSLVATGATIGIAFINEPIIFVFTTATLLFYAVLRLMLWEDSRKNFFCYASKILLWTCIGFFLIAGWKMAIMIRSSAQIAAVSVPNIENVDVSHADIINLFRPTMYHQLWGSLGGLYLDVARTRGNGFIGFTFAVVALLVFLIRIQTKKFLFGRNQLLLFFIGFALMISFSAGPFWHVLGINTHLPMPYYLVGKIFPSFLQLRVPGRWLFPAMLFLGGILALLLKYIFENVKNIKYGVLLAVLLYTGLVLDSLIGQKNILMVRAGISPAFEMIREKGGGTVLEVPLSVTNGYFSFAESSRINMLHQTIHGQPIIGGHLSRTPDSLMDLYAKEPVISYLLDFKKRSPSTADSEEKNVSKFFKYYGVKYILLDKKLTSFNNPRGRELQRYLVEKLKLKLYYDDKDVILYMR